MVFGLLQHAMTGGRGVADKPAVLKFLEPRFARSGSQLELPSNETPPTSPMAPFQRLGSQPALSSFDTPPTKQPIAESRTSALANSSATANPCGALPEPFALEDLDEEADNDGCEDNDETESRKKKVGDAVACILGAVGKAKVERSLKRAAVEIEHGAGAKGPKGQKKATPKVEHPKKDKPKKDDKQPTPILTHEGSRKQYLVRSGLKGIGQNKIFRYKGEADRPKVLRAAKAHCRILCSSRGLPVPDKFKA